MGPLQFIMFIISDKLNCIPYADGTTLNSTLDCVGNGVKNTRCDFEINAKYQTHLRLHELTQVHDDTDEILVLH